MALIIRSLPDQIKTQHLYFEHLQEEMDRRGGSLVIWEWLTTIHSSREVLVSETGGKSVVDLLASVNTVKKTSTGVDRGNQRVETEVKTSTGVDSSFPMEYPGVLSVEPTIEINGKESVVDSGV